MTTRPERVALSRYFACGLLLLRLTAAAHAQEEEEKPTGWEGSAELSAVMTSGNAESESFGLRTQWIRKKQASTLTLEASGLRAESTTTRRFGVGVPGDFRVVEVSTTELTAENYSIRGRRDRSLGEHVFWFVGGGWDRNTFAGIDNRYLGTVGAGHRWIDTETASFSTTYGLTYTRQEEVVGASQSFAGLRLGYEYGRQVTATTKVGSVLVADGNLDQTSDYRLDFSNWVKVAMSDRLALKVSLQALYDNQPSLVELPLVDAMDLPTGTVTAPLDELDLLWTAALVVNF